MSTCSRRGLLAGIAVLTSVPRVLAAPADLEVWKVRGCGCCSAWAKTFEAAGFRTTMHEVDDVAPVRAAVARTELRRAAGSRDDEKAWLFRRGAPGAAGIWQLAQDTPAKGEAACSRTVDCMSSGAVLAALSGNSNS